MSEEKKEITVDANALKQVLQALNGPPHYIRELQATRDNGTGLFKDNPIDVLIKQYNEWVERQKQEEPSNKHREG